MKVCILGAGAYGIALALAFYKNKNEVCIWTKVEDEKNELLTYHENKKNLPNIIIPNDIFVTTDKTYIKNSMLVISTIPLPFFESVCMEINNFLNPNTIFCIASKGIDFKTSKFAHEIIEKTIKTKNVAILSGPTFAIDLAQNSPSGLTVATNSIDTYQSIKNNLESNTLKITYSDDLIGLEICGAIKNVMAIMSGILEAMKTTETTKALFLTEALSEVGNLISYFGGKRKTAYTLAGIGDLLLTCTSKKSRNFTLGTILATSNQEQVEKYLKSHTVEGYYTLISIHNIIKEKNISSPLIELLYQIIFNNKDKKELLTILTSMKL